MFIAQNQIFESPTDRDPGVIRAGSYRGVRRCERPCGRKGDVRDVGADGHAGGNRVSRPAYSWVNCNCKMKRFHPKFSRNPEIWRFRGSNTSRFLGRAVIHTRVQICTTQEPGSVPHRDGLRLRVLCCAVLCCAVLWGRSRFSRRKRVHAVFVFASLKWGNLADI